MIRKNLIYYILTAIFLFISFHVLGSEKKSEGPSKWERLNKLIDEEIYTISYLSFKGPRLSYRLLELYTEKLKLIKVKENELFLRSSFEDRQKLGKKHYFKKSTQLYKKALKFGLNILKDFPNTRYKADIYYTLALNSRDYAKDKVTEKFLLKALRFAPKKSPLVHSTKTSLAEYYYNDKKYKKAIYYYKSVLKNLEDEWHSKHLYNVSWCYLKVKNFDKSLESISKAYHMGKLPKYLPVTDQVLDSIGIFHVHGRRIKEGAQFYIDNLQNPVPYLIKMSRSTADKGLFKDTLFLFDIALKDAVKKKNRDARIELHLAQLDIYRQFSKFTRFFKTSLTIQSLHKELPLKKEYVDEAIDKIRSLVGFLQIKLSKNAKKNVYEYSIQRLSHIITYFDILITLNPKDTDQYRFYQGETNYSVSRFLSAASFYQLALEYSKENKGDDKFRRKIINSLLSVLADASFSRKTELKYKTYTYSNHIKLWPVDPKSRLIYVKLFNLYMETKKIDTAYDVIETYRKHYPQDSKLHRAMLTDIIERNIKIKDTDKISYWINRLESGFLSFDRKYIEKALTILAKILFDKYQQLDRRGNKQDAAQGYISLYKNDKYPKKIRAKSAFNASVLYMELGEIDNSYYWLKNSFKYFKRNEILLLSNNIYQISEQYYLSFDFNTSARLSEDMIQLFCKDNYKKKNQFYNNAIYFRLIEKKIDKALQSLETLSKCKIPSKVVNKTKKSVLVYFIQNRHYDYYFNYPHNHSTLELSTIYYQALFTFFWESKLSNDLLLKNKITRNFKQILKNRSPKNKKIATKIKNIHSFEKYEQAVGHFNIFRFTNNSKFDENLFNQELSNRINNLKKITSKGVKIIKIGDPHISLGVYDLLYNSYYKLSLQIDSYEPQNTHPDYISGFKKQMGIIANNLNKKASEYLRLAQNSIQRNRVITPYNHKVSGIWKTTIPIDMRYPASKLIVPMDTMRGIK